MQPLDTYVEQVGYKQEIVWNNSKFSTQVLSGCKIKSDYFTKEDRLLSLIKEDTKSIIFPIPTFKFGRETFFGVSTQ